MRYRIQSTATFDKWLTKVKDRQAVKAIVIRLTRAETGNFGDTEPVGGGISEMRIFVGKGYRIYFSVQNSEVILLLCGGNKSNKKQQQEDIQKAKNLLAKLETK